MKLLLFVLFVAAWRSIQTTSPPSPSPTHLRASNLPIVHPFKITCMADKSIIIHNNSSYNLDLFVAGNVSSSCTNHTHHFTIDKQNVTLNSSCMDTKERAFLIEAQNRSVLTKSGVMGGKSAIVYRVTCIPDTDGDPVNVTMVPPVSVQATASELVLPNLKIGIFAAAAVPTSNLGTQLNTLTLGKEVQLVIYNDLSGKKMSYMLVPYQCDAHPVKIQTPMLTLLKDDLNTLCIHDQHVAGILLSVAVTNTNVQTVAFPSEDCNCCAHEDKLLSTFNVTGTSSYDLAYAKLYPFKFEGYPDTPVVLECTVYICPKDDVVDGARSGYCEKANLNTGTNRCSQVSATSDYTKKRRRRDVGVGDSGVGKATLRATFSVQEPLIAGGSRCSAGIWGVVATLVYIFK